MRNLLMVTESAAILILSCQLALLLEWVMLRGIFRAMLAGLPQGRKRPKSGARKSLPNS